MKKILFIISISLIAQLNIAQTTYQELLEN